MTRGTSAAAWLRAPAGLRGWHVLAVALVLGEFVARGPVRALRETRDLTVHLGAARVWAAGGDPWDMVAVGDAFEAAGGPREKRPTTATMPSVYPPTTLALEAPLALLDWRTAVVLHTAGSLALVLAALLRLARWAGLGGRRRALLLVGALALAPLQTGLAAGQVAVPAIALLLLGWTLLADRPAAAGVLFGLAAALKPTLALPFLLACAVRPSRPLAAAGAATFGGLLAVGCGRLALAGVPPLDRWRAAAAATFEAGGMNHAYGPAGAIAPMIHLEPLLGRFGLAPPVTTVLVALATVPLLALGAWQLRVARDRATELTALGLVCVASLLATYHRTYDAFLLVVPFAALLAAPASSRPVRAGVVLCLAAFLLPGAPFLRAVARSGFAPAGLDASAAFNLFVLPHQVWALLALQLALGAMLLPLREPASAPDLP